MIPFKTAIKTTLAFFLTGNLLVILHYILKTKDFIVHTTYFYFLMSLLISCTLLIAGIVALILDKHKTETLKTIGITSINIPIAILYFLIVTNTL